MEEYFAAHAKVGYGGAGSRVCSVPECCSFGAIPPTAADFGDSCGLQQGLYMDNASWSHAHKVFDGRSRVSLGQGPADMTHEDCNNGVETEQSLYLQSICTDSSGQLPTMRHACQVFDEMSHSSSDKRVLSVKIHMMTYHVTSDVLYQVFSAYGAVEMITPINSSTGDRVLIQYQHGQMAEKAQELLHGRYIYQSCCQLDIRYAHEAELKILHPFKCTAQPSLDDSTIGVKYSLVEGSSAVDNPSLYEAMCSAKFSSSMSTFEENNATVPCTKIVAEKIMPQVLEQSPSTSLDQGINVEKNNQVILNEISNFVAEWRSKIEQEERSRTEQSELKSELEYFLYHAFDIFQDESEGEMVLEMERKKRKTKEQLRIEQEERETELDYFLYQAFDLFGEELESVLEKQYDKIAPKHGVGTVVGINCGANLATKCEMPQECLMLYSQPLSDFASRVEDSLNHVFGKQLENQKLNHVEPRMHWEPGDQEEGSKLMKLTVESQFLRREEIQGIAILQLNRSYQSISYLELYLQEKLKAILCCNYMPSGGKSKKLTVPWDPGEEENIFIFASTGYRGSATTTTAPMKSCGEDFTVLVLRIINMGSVCGRNGSILRQARISSNRIIIVFTCQEDYWGTHFTHALFLQETKDSSHLTCQVTLGVDGSNMQILERCSYGEVIILGCEHSLHNVISMLLTEIITEPGDLDEKLASPTESIHKIRIQMCVTQCAASNYLGLSLQNDSELSWWDISLLIRTNWQWDAGTVTSTFAVLKQSIWAMDIHFYQSILSPEIEYHWQFVALTSCDSSVQVRNDFCWWQLSLEMKLGWQWDPGIAGHSSCTKSKSLGKGSSFGDKPSASNENHVQGIYILP